ncbi:MAG: hypothetical protein WC742_04870 [Gallionellaceae bacterium]|jgi:hypothetical protein
MSKSAKFREYYSLANTLLNNSSKDEMSEALILLGMDLAHYRSRYGALNLSDSEASTDSGKPNEQQFALLAEGMSILANVLGSVANKPEQIKH